ncbi:hypothetical protein BDZ85DRAFT_320903 [Elsinoe ampelina]|uniref:Small ribosomal subunit protein mS38 n=1 Tax=Elsinoe ampelina TaxID=302913 RepID=A0A6A6G5T6_9PEZI|nr:hypothetical protein BDZ85DRAFT_320903 [Elsinoe ampelina]
MSTMIVSGFRSAARALPPGPRAASTRASTVTAAVPSIPTCRASTGHQRRPSSSKASCPPGDQSDGSRATAASAKAATAESSSAKSALPRTSNGRSSSGRTGRGRKVKEEAWTGHTPKAPTSNNSRFDALPSVPNVDMIKESDLKLSNLFALHRPLALRAPIPPETSQAVFDQLFEPSPESKTNPSDVVATLQSTISALESTHSISDQLRWNIVQESSSHTTSEPRHLDGRPSLSKPPTIQNFVSSLQPYRKPAPPLPVSSSSLEAQTKPARRARRTEQKQDYRATVILRQVEGSDYLTGELQSFEPIKRAMNPPVQQKSLSDKRRAMLSFGKRVRMRKVMTIMSSRFVPRYITVPPRKSYIRMRQQRRARMELPATKGEVGQAEGEEVMQAISVKRQRKLKMKKHKYKKLMKRTRNLRRRLDK